MLNLHGFKLVVFTVALVVFVGGLLSAIFDIEKDFCSRAVPVSFVILAFMVFRGSGGFGDGGGDDGGD